VLGPSTRAASRSPARKRKPTAWPDALHLNQIIEPATR